MIRRLALLYLVVCALIGAAAECFAHLSLSGAGARSVAAIVGCASVSVPTDDTTTAGTGRSNSMNSVSTGLTTLTTSSTNDIIVAFVGNNKISSTGSANPVSSVSDTASLVWTNRSQTSFQNSAAGTPWVDVEMWWALSSGALSNDTVTANFSTCCGLFDNGFIIVAGYHGANTSMPWDSNVSVPKVGNSGSSGAPSLTGASTTCLHDMILMAAATANTASDPPNQTAGTGFGTVRNVDAENGTNFSKIASQQQSVSSAQSSITTSFGTSWNGWVAITDALRGL